jgi:hypothetical protein
MITTIAGGGEMETRESPGVMIYLFWVLQRQHHA